MKKYFLVKIKLEKVAEDGKIVKVSEQYLIDALSFSEAEARIIEEMQPYISGEFEVVAISKKKYVEIVSEHLGINMIDAEANKMLKTNQNQSVEADKWFDCKLNFISLDEEKGIEKKTTVLMLVNANSTRSANDTMVEHMRGSLADWELEKIAETKILDVFNYKLED